MIICLNLFQRYFEGLQYQWWSLETWSRSRHESRDSSRDPFLRVSVSKVSGLETLNVAKKWFIKISVIQIFLFVVFAGKKQPKHARNLWNLKNFKSEPRASAETIPGGANSIFCFPCGWRCNANARSRNALPFLHHNENAPWYAGA